jgi:CubicO group peptidase (beta-lactamase class C family)
MLTVMLIALSLQSPSPAVDRRAVEAAVAPVLEQKRIPGAVIALTRGDDIVLEEAFGLRDVAAKSPMRTDDLFQIGSVTKTFTATLLALCAADGDLDLDDAVAQYLPPEREFPAWTKQVTLRQLATHTSGVPRNPVNRRDVPGAPSVMMPYLIDELYVGLAKTELAAEPGSVWSYSNLGFGVLGHVLERATGMRYEQLVRKRILDPLQMTSSAVFPSEAQQKRLASGYWTEDRELVARPRWQFGEIVGFGGIFSSAHDLARYVCAQTATGESAPFPRSVLQVLHTPTVKASAGGDLMMALGWFVERKTRIGEMVVHGGELDSYSAMIGFAPSVRIGLVVLANKGGDSAESLFRVLVEKVLPALVEPQAGAK